MMHLMEGPEERNLVQGEVSDEPTEVPQHEEHEGVAERQDPLGWGLKLWDSEGTIEGGGDLHSQPDCAADEGDDAAAKEREEAAAAETEKREAALEAKFAEISADIDAKAKAKATARDLGVILPAF